MMLFAAGLPISALGVMADDLWTAVAFISIATSCHQAWSANMFTVASDAFPNRAVGSVVGFGGMCGGIGGMLMLLVAGGMLQWLGSFKPLFIFAGVMHPLAWIAIRALGIVEVDLDRASPRPSLTAVVPAAPRSLSFSRRRLAYNSDAGHFSPAGKTERLFQRAQDIYMESTMGGEFPGEVL